MVKLKSRTGKRASRLLIVFAVTGLLVSCGGGSGDAMDEVSDYDGDNIPDTEDDDADGDGVLDFADPFIDLDNDGLDDFNGLTEAEATSTDSSEPDPVEGDTDGDGFVDPTAGAVCGSEDGSDADSSTAEWNDNCTVERSSTGGQFADSLYAVGIQRVVYCSGFGTGADYTAFSDGEFGPGSETALKSFQTEEGLTADGIVGPRTWERLQERVQVLAVGELGGAPDTLGFTEGRCADIPMFYQYTSAAADSAGIVKGAWELARNTPNADQRIPFSIDEPFGRL